MWGRGEKVKEKENYEKSNFRFLNVEPSLLLLKRLILPMVLKKSIFSWGSGRVAIETRSYSCCWLKLFCHLNFGYSARNFVSKLVPTRLSVALIEGKQNLDRSLFSISVIIKWVRVPICIKFAYFRSLLSKQKIVQHTLSDWNVVTITTSFISIYAQFKSVIRPQFKLILIIHSNGSSQRKRKVLAGPNESRATFRDTKKKKKESRKKT